MRVHSYGPVLTLAANSPSKSSWTVMPGLLDGAQRDGVARGHQVAPAAVLADEHDAGAACGRCTRSGPRRRRASRRRSRSRGPAWPRCRSALRGLLVVDRGLNLGVCHAAMLLAGRSRSDEEGPVACATGPSRPCSPVAGSAQERVHRDGHEEQRHIGDGPVEQPHLLELGAGRLGLGAGLERVRLPQPPAARPAARRPCRTSRCSRAGSAAARRRPSPSCRGRSGGPRPCWRRPPAASARRRARSPP